MRIGGPVGPGSRMTVLPANAPGSLQAVSLAPTSQINVPLAPGARAITAGKLINVPSGSGVGGMPPSGGGPPGVTIQKTSIPVTSPRTISLPYGAAAQVAAIPKVSAECMY